MNSHLLHSCIYPRESPEQKIAARWSEPLLISTTGEIRDRKGARVVFMFKLGCSSWFMAAFFKTKHLCFPKKLVLGLM